MVVCSVMLARGFMDPAVKPRDDMSYKLRDAGSYLVSYRDLIAVSRLALSLYQRKV